MTKHGIIPDQVLYIDFPVEKAYDRTTSGAGFGNDRRVLSERIRSKWENNRGIISYYQMNFDNVKFVDPSRSKLYINDFCVDQIHASLKDRYNYS